MTNLQSLSVFVTERLTLAAQEIFKAVEVTVTEYHEEISRSRQENELLKRRLLEAGIDFYSELQPSLSDIQESETGIGPPVCGEPWDQQSEKIHVKLELSAAQEATQDPQAQVVMTTESISPKPCLQSEQKMEDLFRSQATDSSMDALLPAASFMQIKEEPGELVPDLRLETFCETQTSVSADPSAAVPSSHCSGFEDQLDSHRLASVHKAVRSKRWEITLPSQTPAVTEAVLSLIKTTLPSLSEELLQTLVQRLDLIGVASVDDLALVTPDDLEGVLRPMQRRRLMQAFNAGLSDHTHTPVEPSAIAPSFGETTGLFQIPWDKFPTELLKAMMEGTRPRPSLRREMVRIIVSDLLAVEQKRPGRRVLRQIARELVKKYPRSFCDVCGDNIVGTGFDSLMLQLENRVDNCSRSVTLRSKRPAEGDPVSRKSKKRYDRYGCVQWQPDLPATEDGPSQTVKKMELRNSYAKKKLPETCVRKLMAETYYSQRLSINADNKTVGELKSEWPYLFEASHFFDHTERLLGVPVHKKLAEELSRKGNTIVNFLRQTRATQFAGIEEKLRDPLELLSSVGSYLGDNTEVLLIQKQGLNPATLSLPSTPCIIILGNKRFQIAVDQTVVKDHVCCPLTALSYLFSLFYVLNIRYPKDAALSLEFIQRSLLGINPGRGTKVERRGKKQHKIHPKLLKFLSELSDYQNPWTV